MALLKRYFWLLLGLLLVGVVICLLCIFRIKSFGGIGPSYSLALQNDYVLWVSNSHSKAIAKAGTIVVKPNITKMNTKGSIVFGIVYEEGNLEKGVYKEETLKGYFILDTKTGDLIENLKKDDWLNRLKVYGVTEEPKLIHPSSFFNLFRGK